MNHFPQNTLAAVRGAAPHVDMIEIDVRRCKTGELVVFHDERVDDLTTACGPVRELSFEELSSLRVAGSEETIPSLEAVLDVLPADTGLNVELKHAGMHEDVASLVGRVDNEVLVSSFERDAISEFRDGSIPTAYLFTDSFEENLDTALELGCTFLHPHYERTDAERIERTHEQDMAVNAWTVPTREEVRRLRSVGVDGVIVDSWEIIPD